MPEEDFEIFLSLLGQLLRLDPKQKAAIADELRDHLEERLTELSEEGVPRKDAVRKALEEFGDAAGLASQFTTLSKKRRRRLLMRATLATSAVAGLVFLAIVLFGPAGPNGPPQQVAAQDQEQEQKTPEPKLAESDTVMPEKLLNEVDVEFIDTPLTDAADFLADQSNLTIFLDEQALDDEGIAKDTPINLTAAKTPLYLVLNRLLKPNHLAWHIKNDILYFTTETEAEETRITKYYPVKPILELGYSQEDLMRMIELMTKGPWFNVEGYGGEMLFVGPMLTVRQTYQSQLEVAKLLAALRKLNQPGVLRLEPKEHEKLRAALAKVVDVEFIETPLRDAAAFLSDSVEVPVVLDQAALEEEGIAVDAPITLAVNGHSLATNLELILGKFDAEAVLENGTILITTAAAAEESLSTVIYNVEDLSDSESALKQLEEAVLTVTEGPWIEIDGTGGEMISFPPHTLVVRQRERVHQEFVKLLETLRRADGETKLPALPPRIITQIYRMNADTAEDLLTTLPEFVAPGTWDKGKNGPGSIRKVAAGQNFVKFPEAEKSEKPQKPPTPPQLVPPGKMADKPGLDKEPDPQYIVVPQAVLIIRHTKEVHREIDTFLQSLLPFGSYSAGTPLTDRGQKPSGGGFF
jgi:hypothetical protein